MSEKRDIATIIAHDPITTLWERLKLVAMLTWPAVMAQMSNILMEYIDAAMVGSLGAKPAAAIGLVATTTWLFWGLGTAASTGFAVQIAHLVGAGRDEAARHVVRQGILAITGVAIILSLIGILISSPLPRWLGGDAEICGDSTSYFLIFSIALPFMYLTFSASAMLRCSGNMVVPGIVNVVMCGLDVVFNFFLIFETREVNILGWRFMMPGAGLGVAGASLGTSLAFSVGGVYVIWYLVNRSPRLLHPFAGVGRWWRLSMPTLRRAAVIGAPVALERTVMCGAQILTTAIVAPLGNASIAANSFGVTAESLCYTPGYGIGEAATTLVGQSLGAGRKELARKFGVICVVAGVAVMTLLGGVMWLFAPEMMALFTPDEEVRALGVMALRIEAWAEPLYACSIVIYGACIGAGYTMLPATINFASIWGVRVVLCALLAPVMGLRGVWLAMCVELCVRGLLFLWVYFRGRWLAKWKPVPTAEADALEQIPDDEYVL